MTTAPGVTGGLAVSVVSVGTASVRGNGWADSCRPTSSELALSQARPPIVPDNRTSKPMTPRQPKHPYLSHRVASPGSLMLAPPAA